MRELIHFAHETDDGYVHFDRHVEYLIYRTIPHGLHEYEGKLTVPAEVTRQIFTILDAILK